MKKSIVLTIQIMVAMSCIFAAKKNTKAVLLDWQYRNEGEEIPLWVTAAAQSDNKTAVRELGLDGYKVWILKETGTDLDDLEFSADTAGITELVAREFRLDIKENSIYEDSIKEQLMQKVMEVISSKDIRGLQKVVSFWTKTGTPKTKKPKKDDDYNLKWNYYSVWVMEKALYDIQLEEMIN